MNRACRAARPVAGLRPKLLLRRYPESVREPPQDRDVGERVSPRSYRDIWGCRVADAHAERRYER